MLLDPDSPKSQAIFAATRELDALHLLWRESKYASHEVEKHVDKLQSINVAQFQDSGFIREELNKLRQSLAAKKQGDKTADKEYEEAVARLDSVEGFGTVII